MTPNSKGDKVPHWAKWWAVDKSGGSAFFSHKPDLEEGIWIKTKGKYQTDGYVHINGDEYKDSLLQIKQAKNNDTANIT